MDPEKDDEGLIIPAVAYIAVVLAVVVLIAVINGGDISTVGVTR